MPRLVVEEHAAGLGGQRDRGRVALRLRLGLVLVADGRGPVELEADAARPKSSVAATVSGIVATGVTWPPTPTARNVTRGSRSRSRPIDRNTGRESSPVRLGAERDLQRRGLAKGPVGGERPVVEAIGAGVFPTGSSAGRPPAARCRPGSARPRCRAGRPGAGAGPRRSGTRSRRPRARGRAPWSRPATAGQPAPAPGDRASRRRPVSSKVDEAESGGNSYRNCPAPVSTMTASRVAPSAVRSRTTTAAGSTSFPGCRRSTSGSPRPRMIQSIPLRLDQRQVGA